MQRYILVVNCICKMSYCYITFSLIWYITCNFNISQTSRWPRRRVTRPRGPGGPGLPVFLGYFFPLFISTPPLELSLSLRKINSQVNVKKFWNFSRIFFQQNTFPHQLLDQGILGSQAVQICKLYWYLKIDSLARKALVDDSEVC